MNREILFNKLIRKHIHKFIVWYLKKCGGEFHNGKYGFGYYVTLHKDSNNAISDEDQEEMDKDYEWIKKQGMDDIFREMALKEYDQLPEEKKKDIEQQLRVFKDFNNLS